MSVIRRGVYVYTHATCLIETWTGHRLSISDSHLSINLLSICILAVYVIIFEKRRVLFFYCYYYSFVIFGPFHVTIPQSTYRDSLCVIKLMFFFLYCTYNESTKMGYAIKSLFDVSV